MEVRCQWCGQPMETSDLRRRYHRLNKDGVPCAKEARLECKRQHEKTRRQNGHTKPRNGTGNLGSKRHSDVEMEEKAIREEQYYLQLRRRPKQYS